MVESALSLGRRWGVSEALLGVLILGPLTSIPNAATAIRLGLAGRSTALVGETFNSNAINLGVGAIIPALFVTVTHPVGAGEAGGGLGRRDDSDRGGAARSAARRSPPRGRGTGDHVRRFCCSCGSRLMIVSDRSRLRAFGGERPPIWLGVALVGRAVAVSTAVLSAQSLAPAVSLGVVYLLAVVIVSAFWGAWLGIATAVMSAAAFNFFHIPPVGRFTIADGRNWIALATFFVAAILTSTVAVRARGATIEAERRRAEADLTAEMAQLLGRSGVDDALGPTARRLAQMFELPWATIVLERGVASRGGPRWRSGARGGSGRC